MRRLPKFVTTEQVPAKRSGLALTTLATALSNTALLLSNADPHNWQSTTILGINILLLFIPVVGVAWFNQSSVLPPGRDS